MKSQDSGDSSQEEDGLQQTINRLVASLSVLEELLIALVNASPRRQEVVATVMSEAESTDTMCLYEAEISDDLLEQIQVARARLLAQVAKADPEPAA
jgi:hypothetical protein